MQNQLWQACPRCGDEPVCGDCERCEAHCTCDEETAQHRTFDDAYPGLRQRIAEHHEQGARER